MGGLTWDTLVAVFSETSSIELKNLLKNAGVQNACKIPFGRDCDRVAADRILKHHITLYHWGKEEDDIYLKRLSPLQSIPPCKVTVRPIYWENSGIVDLKVDASEEFSKVIVIVGKYLKKAPAKPLHITLDITTDAKRTQELYHYLKNMTCFPLELEISGLELYKIWNPVKLVKSYPVRK